MGCSVNGLSQSWELDRVRVLGVRAVPAEPQPGEQTVFESLVYLPDGIEMETMIWFACLPEDGTAFGCSTDLSALEDLDTSEDLTPEESFELFTELEEAGVIGIEPFWAPTWTPPLDALDGLTEEQQLEGLSATVNLSLIPTEGSDELDLETAFKRVPVSRATHPNHNPEIIGIKVDGIQYTPGAEFEAAPGQVYEIDPVLSEDSIETYTFINSAGECEERVEEPYFNWYSEYWYYPGIDEINTDIPQPVPYTLHPFTSIEWTAPTEDLEGIVLVVARDRRGGLAWAHINVSVND